MQNGRIHNYFITIIWLQLFSRFNVEAGKVV